jgi:signal transduction histidine kinase
MRDLLAGAGFAVVLAVQAYAVADSWGGYYWVFGCVVGVVVCGLALLRRAYAGLVVAAGAVVVAWLAGLPGEPSPAMAVGLAVLVGAAVRVRPLVPACGVVAGGFVVVFLSWLAEPGLSGVPTVNALGWLGAVAGGLGLRLLDDRRLAAAAAARRDERLALARELHDVVAQHVTGIVLHAQVARRRDPGNEQLAGIETASTEAMAAMREVVGLLRDAPASPVRFDGLPLWPVDVTSTVQRIVQESLTNIARHAPGAGSVTVEVSDDGPPARVDAGGYGLVGMRERVEALGGTLSAGPRPDGWTVRATLPLESR